MTKRVTACLWTRLKRQLSQRRWVSGGSKAAKATDISLIRNVGILAHIDAGKTTTTERMLFYAGLTRHMGDVDDGDTVMDFMQQERERGITINSAAVSFNWIQHRVNLIDTPGHVDFTFEVERSLRVLDGAIALFDGSAGVETQTIAVWNQAHQHNIPRVAFANKMDKPGASLPLTVNSMKQKLNTTPLVIQLPLGEGRDFTGIIDLLSMDVKVWRRGSDGSNFSLIPLLKVDPVTGKKDYVSLATLLGPSFKCVDLPLSRERIKDVLDHRAMLAEQVIGMDDQLIEKIADDSFDPLTLSCEELTNGIRRLTTTCSATPLLCGSSLQNIGVQPLMDSMVTFLPGPQERSLLIPEALKDLYAYAFKVTHDKRRGAMVYLRLYSGQLQPQTTVYNISRTTNEKITRVLWMLADEQHEVATMGEGNIAVAVGMKNTFTGDTIVKSSSAARLAEMELSEDDTDKRELILLGEIDAPSPVFFCSVEPASAAFQKDLDHALTCLAHEDPSLRISVNQDTGQTVLSGMGELHLEIIFDRLRRDFKVDCSLGKLQVAYKEWPTLSVSHKASLDRSIGSKRHTVSLTLNITPSHDFSSLGEPNVVLDLASQRHGLLPGERFTREELIDAIKKGSEGACSQGPLLGFPVMHLMVTVSDLSLGPTTNLHMLSSCVSEGVAKALLEAEVQLLEPYTKLVVTVPDEYVGRALADLSSHRRAQIRDVGAQGHHRLERAISAVTPLASLMGYSTALRTMTSGTGTFTSTFSHYEPVSREQEKNIIQELRGYIY